MPTSAPILPNQPANFGTTNPPVDGHRSGPSTRREILTVTLARGDYENLKATGEPRSEDIIEALRFYLDLIRKTDWRPPESVFGWMRGPVVHFLTAIPRDLADEIRNLPGRFDGHTIEAVRLFLRQSPDSRGFSHQFDFAPRRGDTVIGNSGALRTFASRMISYLLFP